MTDLKSQNYRGLPRSSPSTSPYFTTPPHDYNKDQYSISFSFTPTTPINGNDLVFGNDFDHPIRDRLPPGFGTAMKIVKWGIDPGLDGDVYAEKPYLYGPVGSSVNMLNVGKAGKGGRINDEYGIEVEEGAEGDGEKFRKDAGIPDSEAARKKWFLNEGHRKGFTWDKGRQFTADFFNAYLDFNGMLSHARLKMVAYAFRLCSTTARLHAPNHALLGWTRTTVSSPLSQ